MNDLSLQIFRRERRFASGIELQRYLNGASKEGLAVGSAVFQQIAEEYATRRKQHRKLKLRWRRPASIVKRHMIVIAMLPATFSRSDVTASQEESPPFPRKRQSVTTEGGEMV